MDGAALARLGPWLEEHVGATGPVSSQLIAGGRSNLTYELADAQLRRWALRRPPEGPRVATAHDVLREHRIIAALAEAGEVPVPRPRGSDEGALLGAPFFLMDFVDGFVLRGRRQSSQLTESRRAASAESLISALAAIHASDLRTTGLADLASPTGYLERQLSRWIESFAAARTREVPEIHDLHGWLVKHLPKASETTLVHGDFRLDNAIVDDGGKVLAILDWELATLGDPLADLALTLAYWAGEGDEAVGPTALPGFPDRAGVIDAYTRLSGRQIDDLTWYLVFAYWKLACVAEQVAARYARGGGGGDRSGTDQFSSHTARFTDRAYRARGGEI